MFKDKKNIKILLPVVVIIWGILIYKFVDVLTPDHLESSERINETFKTPKIQKKETFDLLPIESDPFLGKLYNSPNSKTIGSNSNKEKIEWPAIDYLGLVSDKKSRNRVSILQINGNQIVFKKGETVEGITVLKSTSASIKVKYKGQIKEFPIL